jgi:Na+-transporting NADH:ubiquinone oxidoreductase subunit D
VRWASVQHYGYSENENPSIVMVLAVIVVCAFSNVIISFLRNSIPNRICIVQLTVVATMVILVDQFLKVLCLMLVNSYRFYMIIVNCIIMAVVGSLQVMATNLASFLDGIGNEVAGTIL